MMYDERQIILSQGYQFECSCEACLQKFPIETDMQVKSFLTKKTAFEVGTMLDDNVYDNKTTEAAIKLKKMVSKALNQKEVFYPCRDLFYLQDTLLKCMHVLAFRKPLEFVLAPKK